MYLSSYGLTTSVLYPFINAASNVNIACDDLDFQAMAQMGQEVQFASPADRLSMNVFPTNNELALMKASWDYAITEEDRDCNVPQLEGM